MGELITQHEDSEKRVSATFHKNVLVDGDKKYATVKRNTATLENLIAVVKKNNPLVSETVIRMLATEFKIAAIEKLRAGEAVNLFDLGVMYLTATGSIDAQSPTAADVPGIGIGFTPSKEAREAVSGVSVGNILAEGSAPLIKQFTDLYTEQAGNEVTEGMPMLIAGERLKVGGDGERTGVFFAPVLESGEMSGDEASWVKAAHVFRNMPKSLSLILPPELKAGTSWFVVVRTSSARGGRQIKSVREGVSERPLTVVAAPALEQSV